ncbi:MAG: PAS domain S-box protein, partial [Eubacteriales bacterium]|nr:PAS domain S-box protein [Eubacteriales bacterium]
MRNPFQKRVEKARGPGAESNPAFTPSLAKTAASKRADFLQQGEGLRITLMSMGDGVITTDENGYITFLNPSAQELTGWALEDALGRPFAEVFRIFSSVTGLPGENVVDTVLRTGQKVNLANHTVLICKDGAQRFISDSAAPIRDDQGALVGAVLIFSDVTQRYLLQRQLQLSEARNAAAVEMAQIGTWEYDYETGATIWSPLYRHILGYPEGYLPTADSWKEVLHPDDAADAIAAQQKQYFDIRFRIYRKNDGALRHIRTYASAVCDEDGRVRKLTGAARDITDELEAGRRIRESEERFRTTFEQAVIGMAHIGIDGSLLRVNQSLCKTLRYTKEELLAKNMRDIIHPGDLQIMLDATQKLFRERSTTKEEIRRCLRKDGVVVLLAISSSVMVDRFGNPLYLMASLQDVTAHIEAQTALAKNERRLMRAQEISQTGNWEIDLITMQMWASDEAFRIYGFEKTETNLLPLAIVQGAVVGEDRSVLDGALDRLLRENTSYDVEFSVRRFNDGGLRRVHSLAVAERDAEGRPLRVSGVLQDITEKRRLEEEYEKALSTTPDGFWICGSDIRVRLVNDAVCSMTGYAREELIGMRISELETHADPSFMADRRKEVLSMGAKRFETQMRRKDGSLFDAEVSLSYIPSTQSTCAFMRDITERKKRESRISYLSYHDVLTELYNRTYFEAECARLDEAQTLPVAIVMSDVNGLKLTNDVFGHLQGDLLLRAIADILLSGARPEYIVARIGGDEFCVLIPGAGAEEAKAYCERIARACEQSSFPLEDGNVLHPSLAMGYAVRLTAGQSLQRTFREAEDAMYKRKLL